MINTPKVEEKMKKRAIHVRLDLEPGDPLWGIFVKIKDECGVVSNTEVLRVLIRNSLREKKQCFDGSLIQRTLWPSIKPLKEIAECGEVPGTQGGDEYAHNT